MSFPSPSPNQAIVVLDDATITTDGAYASPINVSGAGHVDVLIVVAGEVTGTLPTLTVSVNVIEILSDTVIATYSATDLTEAGVQSIVLDNTLADYNLIGDYITVTWTVGGTDTPTFPGVYVRVIPKPVA